jgi:hypothetical protein
VIGHRKPVVKSVDEEREEGKGEKPKIEGTNEKALGRMIEFCKEVERFGDVEHIGSFLSRFISSQYCSS